MTTTLTAFVAGEVRAEIARQRVRQRTLAETLGLSQAQVSERMRGEIEFKVSELVQIAHLLAVPVSAFVPHDPGPYLYGQERSAA